MSLAEIRRRYGSDGIRDFDPSAQGGLGAVSDDTQMTMFTAEGLLRAIARDRQRGDRHPVAVVWHAYHRWMRTQRERPGHDRSDGGDERDGWLVGLAWGDARRAPGTTCLAALRGGRMGTREAPLNDSKGCGGVMRVAPVGLLARSVDEAFATGCAVAAVTHGHPTGWIAAGALAVVVRALVAGGSLEEAVAAGITLARQAPGHEETVHALEAAVRSARTATPSPETVEQLGGGWVAEEALAIAVHCALVHRDDFAAAVRLAVNHSGDSDSTGAITGSILGVLLGEEAIPAEWRERVEHRESLVALADDLLVEWRDGAEWRERYPGW
jgi:ADP-ribosylglycohydrolase